MNMATVYLCVCEPHVVDRRTKVEFLINEKDRISSSAIPYFGTVLFCAEKQQQTCCPPPSRYGYLEYAECVEITGK